MEPIDERVKVGDLMMWTLYSIDTPWYQFLVILEPMSEQRPYHCVVIRSDCYHGDCKCGIWLGLVSFYD